MALTFGLIKDPENDQQYGAMYATKNRGICDKVMLSLRRKDAN
ncbi:hypothetical protein ACFJIV_02635 [Mucilaginibacter sp. UC70_90]